VNTATGPDAGADPEAVHRSFLASDMRPVISAASTARKRAALGAAAAHLCTRLQQDITAFPAYGADQRPP